MALKTIYRIHYFLAAIMLAFIFWIDLLIPLGFAGGSVYIFPVFLIARIPGTRAIILTASIAVILTIIGYFLSPSSEILTIAMTNRIFSICAIVITAFYGVTTNKKQKILQDQAEALKSQNVALEEYANIAAHDLQEPLRKVQTFTSFLAEDYNDKLDDEGRHLTKVIIQSTARLKNLVSDMLEYTQLSDKLIEVENVDISAVIANIIDDFTVQIKETNANITISDLSSLKGNKAQFHRLFQNLLSNSFKYSSPDRTLEITISESLDHSGYHQLYFEDNGIGFDKSFAQQVFKPLFRLKEKENIEGTGIGLAQCKKIMENVGGNIFATPKPEGGVIFTLQFKKD